MTIRVLGSIIIIELLNIIHPAGGGVNRMPMRKLKVKPIHLGPYSRGIVLPAWWFKLNQNPKELQLGITMDIIEITALPEDAGKEEPHEAEAGSGE